MNRILQCGLAGLAVVALLALLGPLLVLSVVLLVLTGLFAAAVVLWALVLLAERWIDEGLSAFSFLDALDASIRDIVLGLQYKVYTR